MPGKLWDNTREWHHKCEGHPVGAAMAAGTPPMEWYASWLQALLVIHSRIDPHMPSSAHRTKLLAVDLKHTGVSCILSPTLINFIASDLSDKVGGYAYVLTGAHLMGGEIMRRRLAGYPTSHLEWDDRKETLAYLQSLRDQEQYTSGALECFQLLYNCMEDIHKE